MRYPPPTKKRWPDLRGKSFGRLTAIAPQRNNRGQRVWLCKCNCGKEALVYSYRLLNGHTQSCGCLRYERLRNSKIRHGMAGTRLFTIWAGMRQRCTNSKNSAWPDYGGRGIKVYPGWEDFEVFHAWAMLNGYQDDLSIDRIDNDAGYCPENCRWATCVEQSRNLRSNRILMHGGRRQTLTEWAEELGILAGTLQRRIAKCWPIERALTEPIRQLRSKGGNE